MEGKQKGKVADFAFFRPVPAVPHTGRVWRQVTGKTLSTSTMTTLMMMMTMMMRIMLFMLIFDDNYFDGDHQEYLGILNYLLNLSKLLPII